MTALTNLGLNNNQLTGVIPSYLSSLTALTVLYLGNNQLTGVIPSFLSSLTTLTQVGLYRNQLTGVIPSSLSALTALTVLGLSSNQLTGVIPSSLSSLTALIGLGLHNNQLTGAIPSSLSSLTALTNFSLAGNLGLVGSIPEWLCDLQSLRQLELGSTGLVGTIPECMYSKLRNLSLLNLQNVQVTGPLDQRLFTHMTNLKYLVMSGASLSGEIPDVSAGRALESNLKLLALVGCGLSGTIPSWIGYLPNITAIDLSGNDFTGPIPLFQPGTELQSFSAANNRLTGALEPLHNCFNLTRLNVEDNAIGGTVSNWLAHQSESMQRLSLFNNLLSCDLPDETNINTTIAHTILTVLQGNVFGCPVPHSVTSSDSYASSYRCGSEEFEFAAAATGVAVLAVFGAAILSSVCRSPGVSMTSADWTSASFESLETLISAVMMPAVLILVIVMLPVYSQSASLLECRYMWSLTAAFLKPDGLGGTDAGGWVFGISVAGGLVGGVGVMGTLIRYGSLRGVVSLGGYVRSQPSSTVLGTWWEVGVACCFYLGVLVCLVSLNAGFVLLEESSDTSGPLRYVVVLVFAVLHEIVDHVLGPVMVSAIVLVAGVRTRATTHIDRRKAMHVVFVVAIAIELANSVLAPVIAQLGVSSGCFRDQIFNTPTSITTSVDVGECPCLKQLTENECNLNCNLPWTTYPVSVSYTPPFRFQADRCLSSIVTLYTPEYLVIFTIRVLLYPIAWILARRRTPWMVAGSRPPMLVARWFVHVREQLIWILVGCGMCMPTDAVPDNGQDEDQTSGSVLVRGDLVLEMLHCIEPATHCFNLLAIAIAPGLFSPLVALFAAMTMVCKHLTVLALNCVYNDPEEPGHVLVHDTPEMPVVCLLMALFVQSIYLLLLMTTAGTWWLGCVVVVMNCSGVCLVLWYQKQLPGHRDKGSDTMPIELTEMLLDSSSS